MFGAMNVLCICDKEINIKTEIRYRCRGDILIKKKSCYPKKTKHSWPQSVRSMGYPVEKGGGNSSGVRHPCAV